VLATTTSIAVGRNPDGATTAVAAVIARVIEVLREVE